MENLSGQTVKGYELRERIGTGGFGAVYKAYQSTVGREVAVKVVLPHFSNHPDFIRRFEIEAHLVARLEHLHVVPLYDYWRDADGAYLVMRWLRGGSLRDMIKNGPIEFGTTALLVDQIASALTTAHRSNIIHRDLKPANILLDEDGNAYLADFGIAKDVSIQQGITDIDTIVGSPDYLSPEQARSEPVTPCTDIYSLGVVLYEMLTGQHPFPDLNTIERLYKHLNDPLPIIATLPVNVANDVNAVIQKATAKNPQHRFKDALEMAVAFRQAVRLASGENVVEILTQREQEILQHIIEGRTNRQIADELVITVMTVKWYITQIYRKLGVRSRVQAIVRARELNLIARKSTDSDATHVTSLPLLSAEDVQLQNPYKGLRAFQAADNQDFFGRERVIEKLVKRLGDSGDYTRFLAVIGPSGSGKSSLVKAGLIPALWRGDLRGSEKWFVVEMLPGAHPVDELEVALARIAANQATNLKEHLQRDERGLFRAAQLILPDDGSELVLIIDQFEEVFTLVHQETERAHFLNLLYTAITEPRSRVRVIITLRADFYDRPLHYAKFGELVRSRMETVLPMSAEELERAIRKPVERIGVTFEPGLVASIVAGVNYQPGALPLLEYALTELFEQRKGRVLTQEAYQAIGQTVGAVAKRADDIYQGFDDTGKEMTRQMFLRLVTLGEGVEDTRRRVERSELLAIAATPDMMDEVIDTFVEHRLLSLDNDPSSRAPTVEMAHEAILREWERLSGWLNDSRSEIRLQRQLAAMAAEWRAAGRDVSFLAHGSRLEQYEKWVAESELALTTEERSFLEASLVERARQQDVERIRQAREIRLERRSLNFLRALVGVLLLATLGAIGLTGFAFNQRDNAQDNFMRAERIRLAAQAQIALEQGAGGELPALLSIRSLQYGYSPEADTTLLNALSRGFADQQFVGHTAKIGEVVFSPDGRFVLTAGTNDNTARLWDAQTGQEVRRFVGHTAFVNGAVFSPDARYVLTAGGDATARLWDTQTGQELHRLVHPGGKVFVAEFSPDGRYIVTASSDHRVYLWDAQTQQQLRSFVGHTGEIWFAAFSPDGQYIGSASEDHTARLWNVQTGKEERQFLGHSESVSGLRFSPDGRYIVTTSWDKTVRVWDVQTGLEVRRLVGHTDMVYDAAFSPDGRQIITGSLDKTARLWDVETGRELHQFRGHTAGVGPVMFAPDGQRVITGGFDLIAKLWSIKSQPEPRRFFQPIGVHYADVLMVAPSPDGRTVLAGSADGVVRKWDLSSGAIVSETAFGINLENDLAISLDNRYGLTGGGDGLARLWDIQTGKELKQFIGHTGPVWRVLFSPDNRLVLTGGGDNTARLWNLETGKEQQRFLGHSGPVRSLALSTDGRFVLTGSDDNTARLWDAQTGKELEQFIGHSLAVRAVAFSPDASYVVTASEDETARLWDTRSGKELRQFVGHTGPIWAVAFSPDGKYILTGSVDQTARLWDISTGQVIRQFVGQTEPVRYVTFSSDGRQVFVADTNIVYLWRTNLNDLIDYVCAELRRDFTHDERVLYSITDDTPTCAKMANQPGIVQATWTPFMTSRAPRPTVPPISVQLPPIQMFFSNDSTTVRMGAPVQDVYLNIGNGKVIRPVELSPTTLEQPVYTTADRHNPSFISPPFETGPFDGGKPLGFTLREWLAAEGTGTYTVNSNRAVLDLQFKHLVPKGVYTLWCARIDLASGGMAEQPCGAKDGSENTFIADEAGNGKIRVEIDAFPPSTKQIIYEVAAAYHSDGLTHGEKPGDYGRNVHVQLYYDFHAPSGS